jgi:hypothetical protein
LPERLFKEDTMKKAVIIGALALSFGAGLFGLGSASAAPIECSGNQVATNVDDGWWSCVNNGGNENESGDSKSPNGNPNFRR